MIKEFNKIIYYYLNRYLKEFEKFYNEENNFLEENIEIIKIDIKKINDDIIIKLENHNNYIKKIIRISKNKYNNNMKIEIDNIEYFSINIEYYYKRYENNDEEFENLLSEKFSNIIIDYIYLEYQNLF